MFVKEPIIYLLEQSCSKENTTKVRKKAIRKFVLLEDGRMVPVEPGGMVEVGLSELGAKVVEVDLPNGEKVSQSK